MGRRPEIKRLLLKVSGEVFGSEGHSIDMKKVDGFAGQLIEAHGTGIELAVVAGGGNILRGAVLCSEGDLGDLRAVLEENEVPIVNAERAMIPSNLVDVDLSTGDKLLRILEIIQDHDDVQNVWVNANFVE